VEDKFNLGAGVLGGVVIGQSNSSFGIFYEISTIGSRDKHLSIGLGYGFAVPWLGLTIPFGKKRNKE